MRKLDAERLHRIMSDCLYRDDELEALPKGRMPEGVILVEGIINKYGLHPERIHHHKTAIEEMLAQLPDAFMKDTGGGWSFLEACVDKDGHRWGEHRNMEELFVLGEAIGKVKMMTTRRHWTMMPGGMPYYIVDLT